MLKGVGLSRDDVGRRDDERGERRGGNES
jgi:hypothetical protein